MATRSSTLAWKIPFMEEPGRLQSMEVEKNQTWLSNFTFTFRTKLSTNIYIIEEGEDEEEERGKGGGRGNRRYTEREEKNVFEDIIGKNFPNLRKETGIQVQDV